MHWIFVERGAERKKEFGARWLASIVRVDWLVWWIVQCTTWHFYTWYCRVIVCIVCMYGIVYNFMDILKEIHHTWQVWGSNVGFLHVPIKIGTSTKISPKSKPYSKTFSWRNNYINPSFFSTKINTHLDRIMNPRTTPSKKRPGRRVVCNKHWKRTLNMFFEKVY